MNRLKNIWYIIGVVLLVAILTSCHSTKTVSALTSDVVNSNAVRSLQSDSTSIGHTVSSLALQLDSFDMWVDDYDPRLKNTLSDSCFIHSLGESTLVSRRSIHIRANKATLAQSSSVASSFSKNIQQTDSIKQSRIIMQSADKTEDTTAIANPPNLTIIILAILFLLISFIYWKFK